MHRELSPLPSDWLQKLRQQASDTSITRSLNPPLVSAPKPLKPRPRGSSSKRQDRSRPTQLVFVEPSSTPHHVGQRKRHRHHRPPTPHVPHFDGRQRPITTSESRTRLAPTIYDSAAKRSSWNSIRRSLIFNFHGKAPVIQSTVTAANAPKRDINLKKGWFARFRVSSTTPVTRPSSIIFRRRQWVELEDLQLHTVKKKGTSKFRQNVAPSPWDSGCSSTPSFWQRVSLWIRGKYVRMIENWGTRK